MDEHPAPETTIVCPTHRLLANTAGILRCENSRRFRIGV